MSDAERDAVLAAAVLDFSKMAADEIDAVRALGVKIGYGRIIQISDQLWTELIGKGTNPYRAYIEQLGQENMNLKKQLRSLQGKLSKKGNDHKC